MASTDIEKSCTVSETVKYRLKHTWIIKDFSLFYADTTAGDTEPGYPSICSEPFHCLQDKRYQFALTIYPRGQDEKSKDFIGVFLNATFKGTIKVAIKLKLSILNERKEIGQFSSKL